MCEKNKKGRDSPPVFSSSSNGTGTTTIVRTTFDPVTKVKVGQQQQRDGGTDEGWGIAWRNVIIMAYIHTVGTYGLYIWFSGQLYWTTIVLGFIFGYMTSFGVTAGAHRLWAHKCYKAKLPLRIILCIMQTVGCQNSIYEWCRDHRVHHKFTETDADPHNVKRGFFFAHVGWLLVKKHDDVKIKGKVVDMSDLEQDPVVMFQKKFFIPLTVLGCFLIPYYLAVHFGEDRTKAWNMVITRYMLTLNFTWLVNSAAHLWGGKPYDKSIHAVENKFVSGLTVGEGWHNYHHTFPWDYKAAELTSYNHNWATAFINFFAWIGWAYDLKTVPERIVLQRVRRTGDGTHPSVEDQEESANANNNDNSKGELSGHEHSGINAWGWDDQDVSEQERAITLILNREGDIQKKGK